MHLIDIIFIDFLTIILKNISNCKKRSIFSFVVLEMLIYHYMEDLVPNKFNLVIF